MVTEKYNINKADTLNGQLTIIVQLPTKGAITLHGEVEGSE